MYHNEKAQSLKHNHPLKGSEGGNLFQMKHDKTKEKVGQIITVIH